MKNKQSKLGLVNPVGPSVTTFSTVGGNSAFKVKQSSRLPDCPSCKNGTPVGRIYFPFAVCLDCNNVFRQKYFDGEVVGFKRVKFCGEKKFTIKNSILRGVDELGEPGRSILVFLALKWANRRVFGLAEIMSIHMDYLKEFKADFNVPDAEKARAWFSGQVQGLLADGYIANKLIVNVMYDGFDGEKNIGGIA